ncbi:hypothetical protein SPRG_01126 [Saprolegnia parasitica CBS 223.65]|uniref:Gamma-butyrobetaine hydroxylase-like N-terminal domain-containing protein n=1 Tax=Saprolegnia parasitica (strain CBS 223.65) TaxID=695850 RepID=A0A067D7S6_SAPPC|nr:hypothetical protein SPRG_01126 [Saprolegnia parasitica CBS 223.65]KDO35062.1 hypothetical protein SPRG_01126 [Saprolegnia parasitica CBS 223.65]|eukprot:XP_012194715.1 hypothetical protein SPRG_01126 [Saprolegnia parasitica CBS 223.65]
MIGFKGWRAVRLARTAGLTTLSPRKLAAMEAEVMERLRSVKDDLLNADLPTLGRIKNLVIQPDHCVSLDIETPSRVLRQNDQWIAEATEAIQSLPWVSRANVSLASASTRNPQAPRHSALANVSNIVAVSSCKGGVGKSTVAVNLAFALQKRGARVGLLDADVYGPSLPTMISPDDRGIRKSKTNPSFVEPVRYHGVECMSFGFVNSKAAPGAGGKGAAVMRGAMVSKVIDQLVLGTEWGALDYLVIDMPPGTGDIHMSLAQQTAITTAVIVTTPQKLSFVDVEKGISMFEDLKIPTSAVVENMSYFDCAHGHRHYPFGHGHLKQLQQSFDIQHTFQFPMAESTSDSADAGRPLVLTDALPEVSVTFESLAITVAEECVKLKHLSKLAPELLYDSKRGIVLRFYTSESAHEVILPPVELRAQCRCAACIEEFTGKPLLDPETIPDDIRPTAVQRKGNYAFAVVWSDGHSSSLYTFEHLRKLAQV